jgi:hypothetical protein
VPFNELEKYSNDTYYALLFPSLFGNVSFGLFDLQYISTGMLSGVGSCCSKSRNLS